MSDIAGAMEECACCGTYMSREFTGGRRPWFDRGILIRCPACGRVEVLHLCDGEKDMRFLIEPGEPK